MRSVDAKNKNPTAAKIECERRNEAENIVRANKKEKIGSMDFGTRDIKTRQERSALIQVRTYLPFWFVCVYSMCFSAAFRLVAFPSFFFLSIFFDSTLANP
jgi:hypothetical protein